MEASGKHVTGALTIDTTVTGLAADTEDRRHRSRSPMAACATTPRARISRTSPAKSPATTDAADREAHRAGSPGQMSPSPARSAYWKPEIPVDLKLDAKNAQPIASNIVTANLNADITSTARPASSWMSPARFTSTAPTCEIPSGLPPNVAVLDVRRPGKAAPAARREPAHHRSRHHGRRSSADPRERPRAGCRVGRRAARSRHERLPDGQRRRSSCSAARSRSPAVNSPSARAP